MVKFCRKARLPNFFGLLLFLSLVADGISEELSLSALQKFPYELRPRLEKNSLEGAHTKIRIIEIRGTDKEFKVDESYVVLGEIRSREPRTVTLYAGITNPENTGAVDLEGYSRYFYPTQKKETFIVGFTYQAEGAFHVSAYPQTVDGTDWSRELFDLRIGSK